MSNTFLSQVPKNVYAREIMTTKLVTLRPDIDVFEGVRVLIKYSISGAPVIDEDGKLLGVFSEKSVMKVLLDAAYEQLPTHRVDSFMDTTPLTIDENTQLMSIAQIFATTSRRRLPVLKDGKLVGQVSRRDVVRAAYDIIREHKSPQKTLLYLSALREMNEAPTV